MNQSIEMKPTIRTGSVDMSFYSPSLYQSGNSPPPKTHTTTTFPSVTHLIHTNDSTPTGCWHLVYDKRHVIVDISGIFVGVGPMCTSEYRNVLKRDTKSTSYESFVEWKSNKKSQELLLIDLKLDSTKLRPKCPFQTIKKSNWTPSVFHSLLSWKLPDCSSIPFFNSSIYS